MARNNNNLLTEGSRGAVGKQIVYKKINGKSVLSKYPDMSQVVYNKKQKGYQSLFAQGVEYAKAIMEDPEKNKIYEKKIRNDKRTRNTSVYHTALKEFMAMHSHKVPAQKIKSGLQKYKETFDLTERHEKAVKYLLAQGSLTNATYKKLNNISRITATRDLKTMVQLGLIAAPEAKGAGARYILIPLPEKSE